MKGEKEYITKILHGWGYVNPCLIGKGAFSQVYRVKERTTGCFYACKVSVEQEMLQREVRMLKNIFHPLFPAFYEIKEQEGISFLFMEYISGRTLRALLAKRGHLSERQVIRISMELAEGLCYLQERNPPIVFRDVKPENIIIREDGRVKLLDMGSAGVLDENRDNTYRVITGTPGYAAPEQWQEAGNIGCYSDVYALGKVMYFMLTGNALRDGAAVTADLYSRRLKLKRGLRRLIEDCLREDVQERIPNMRCFLNQLEVKCNTKVSNEYIFQKNVIKFHN